MFFDRLLADLSIWAFKTKAKSAVIANKNNFFIINC